MQQGHISASIDYTRGILKGGTTFWQSETCVWEVNAVLGGLTLLLQLIYIKATERPHDMTDSRVLICHWYGWCIFWEIVGSNPIIPPVPLSSQGGAFSRVKSVNLQLVHISGFCGLESRHHPPCPWFPKVVYSQESRVLICSWWRFREIVGSNPVITPCAIDFGM